MKNVFAWLMTVTAFLATASCQRRFDTPSEVVQPDQNKMPAPEASKAAFDPDSMYFPPDTPQSLYEYSMAGETLRRFQKEITMVVRVDGTRTINGKTYYKEVTEYTGQEDFLQALKGPDMPTNLSQVPEIKTFIEQLESMSKPDISFARWDQAGEWSLDSDDLTKPEVLATPRHMDVGTEWNEGDKGHAKAVSIEDIKIGDQTYKDCLKIRISGTANGTTVEGAVVYAARGIGMIELVFPKSMGDFSWVLKKYRR